MMPVWLIATSFLLNMFFVRWFVQFCWIGVCAVAMLWQTTWLFPVPEPTVWLSGFVFCATVFGYNFTGTLSRRRAGWVMGGLSVLLFFKLDLLTQLILILPALIWLLYYDRYRPGQGTGLRQYPILKPIAIALAWAAVTVLLPLPIQLWTATTTLFVGQTAFIFALALAYDLCDQPHDLREGLRTLIMELGPNRSYRLIEAALVLATGCILIGWMTGQYSWQSSTALVLAYSITVPAIRWIAPRSSWTGWRKAAIDGLMVLQVILVWLSLNLF